MCGQRVAGLEVRPLGYGEFFVACDRAVRKIVGTMGGAHVGENNIFDGWCTFGGDWCL